MSTCLLSVMVRNGQKGTFVGYYEKTFHTFIPQETKYVVYCLVARTYLKELCHDILSHDVQNNL